MEKEEELKNSELVENEAEGMDMEGEGMDMEGEGMNMEGEGYDQEEFEDGQEEYTNQNQLQGNMDQYKQQTGIEFYPPQNQMVSPGYGGALRPVSANVMKGRKRMGQKRGDFNADFDVRTRPK